ncbi:hypothetical protein VTO42DRAFT_6460 [Malbranchea cinnamomea]
MASSLVLNDIHALGKSDATNIIEQITRIEKRTFPTSEAFEFDLSLWRKKPNTRVIYGVLLTSNPSNGNGRSHNGDDSGRTTSRTNGNLSKVVAYAVYVRIKGTALLHKVCIAEPYRHQGLGKALMGYIEQRLRKEGCRNVHLWVDQDREAARRLYAACGFEERERVVDYYGPGRTGIKMILDLDRAER